MAWNLWAGINRRPLLPFKYQHLGDMMSLGAFLTAVHLPVQHSCDCSAQCCTQHCPLAALHNAALAVRDCTQDAAGKGSAELTCSSERRQE